VLRCPSDEELPGVAFPTQNEDHHQSNAITTMTIVKSSKGMVSSRHLLSPSRKARFKARSTDETDRGERPYLKVTLGSLAGKGLFYQISKRKSFSLFPKGFA
jgi:hypothetical protein